MSALPVFDALVRGMLDGTSSAGPRPLPFVADDGGRAAAGFKGSAGDCVARSIAIASERPYREVYDELAHLNAQYQRGRKAGVRSARNGVSTAALRHWFDAYGWRWTPTMGIGTGTTVHLAEGELPSGRLVARCSCHLVAVIDGVIHDTYNPSRDGTRCVYGYWSKP